MKRLGLLLFIVLLAGNFAFAQTSGKVVSAKIVSSVNKFKPGNSYPVAVELNVRTPFHINSNTPSEDYLIPTTINFENQAGVTFGKITYPAAELKHFAFSEKPLSVYEKTVRIFSTVTVSSEFQGKNLALDGTVSYQACNDQTCLPPEDVSFSGNIPAASAGEAVEPINPNIFPNKTETAVIQKTAAPQEDGLAQTFAEKGLLLTFVFVFLGGLALNLTPCVYPLIPITVSYFGGQSQGKKGSLLSHALIYVLGMAITYSILGVIAALTGSLFGSALQNPIVLVIIAIILVGLALSMFDMYEIRVPAFLSNFAGGAKQGFFGSFFMGLTVGIVAAPCIGPFVLALLTFVGNRGDVILGFWMFFVLAMGLGVPFLFLALFSGSLNRLPRSGAWMIWVRGIFGFILIAMAIYFLQPLFPNMLLYYLALALTMLIGGIYMAWIEPTKTPGKAFPVIRNLVGIIFFAIALFIGSTGIQSYINDNLAGAKIEAGQTAAANEIQWSTYSPDLLKKATADGKPVMIDFYADWCIPCKELEKYTFSAPEVVKMSRNFVMLKMDMTKGDSPLARELKQQYKIKGVPTLVFLAPNGQELESSRVVGFMEKESFLPVLQSVLQASQPAGS
ncbi:MAG: protein-disulfide reductase DsbD [Calditrichia bacterium]